MSSAVLQTYVIAEMACSHDGDVLHAKAIIDGAGSAGANAIQFQIWQAKNMMAPTHKDFPLLQKIELSYAQWEDLYLYSKQRFPKMDVIACVYDTESIGFCDELEVDAYKIHNADLTNPLLVKQVARSQRRIDLSVGGALPNEIEACLGWIRSINKSEIWMMYGLQNFPTSPSEISIGHLLALSKQYDCPVGYQDHSDPEDLAAYWLPAVAVSQGVRVIEKHMTHDRSKKGVDHQAALNPDEFDRFVKMIRGVEIATRSTSTERALSQAEEQYRQYARKSILFARDLPSGHTLTENDFLFLRADTMGVSPHLAEGYLGKQLTKTVNQYEHLSDEVVA